MSVKNIIPDDGSLWSIRVVDISGNYGQKLLFDASGNAIVRTGNTDRLTIGNTGAWVVQGGMTYNNVSNTLTATTFSGALSGNATSSTNLAGGAGGQIPYQSAVNTTALLANGTAGQVLTSAGTTLAPTWTTPVSGDPTITDTNTDAVFYPTFVSGTGAAQTLRADATIGPFSINPSTGNFNVADTFKITQNAVALGKSAGQTTQSSNAVAIGASAGQTTQGSGAVAIGTNAGQGTTTGQGANSIAIGLNTGVASQTAGSICLNASGLALNPSTASFYVNPIATTQQPAVTVVQERQGVVYNTTTSELTAGAFNTYSVCYNQIVQGSDKSFALTPVGTGITATVWQCTFVGERGGGSLPYLSTGIATFLGGVNRWTWAGYNGGGDFGTPTRFYGVVGSQLLWFSCGDFADFDNVRFTFTRLY